LKGEKEMKKRYALTKIILILLFVFLAAWGCRSVPVTTGNMNGLGCDELLAGVTEDPTEENIGQVLDRAAKEGQIETCFIPAVKKCLDMGWDIPHENVKQALKIFNKAQHREYFNKVFVRYYNAMIFKDGVKDIQYRDADRDFLIAYIRAGLKDCTSRDCYQLMSARQICSRLDPELYDKFFD
jgi:hypothetical protein